MDSYFPNIEQNFLLYEEKSYLDSRSVNRKAFLKMKAKYLLFDPSLNCVGLTSGEYWKNNVVKALKGLKVM